MRSIAALLGRIGRDGSSDPSPGAKTGSSESGGPHGSRGNGVGSGVSDGSGADRRGDEPPDGGNGQSPPTHVCAICRNSFTHAPASCPDCGNTAVTPLDDWESSELIRHMSGGG